MNAPLHPPGGGRERPALLRLAAAAARAAASNDPRVDRATGLVLLAITAVVVADAFHHIALWDVLARVGVVVALTLMTPRVPAGRRIFVWIGVALLLAALIFERNSLALIARALDIGAFIAAFFVAQGTLRVTSSGSAAIERAGRFIASRPPGRRYLALTAGSQLFGLVLGYGAISLLGGLAETSVRDEPDPGRRERRLRRMLLATQRGFISILPWSPLGFAVAITTSLIPGARWIDVVAPCLVSGFILAGTGYALDSLFKPPNAPASASPNASPNAPPPAPPDAPPPAPQREDWLRPLAPLIVLLALLVGAVAALSLAFDLRAVAAVVVAAPALALGWLVLQQGPSRAGARAASYWTQDVPAYRGEIVLLVMAGAIGVLGGELAKPLVAAAGVELAALPPWALHLALLWVLPLSGQIGMNPILAVGLLAPLLPSPAEAGGSPVSLVLAITSGWALTGANSPFTANTLLVGAIAKSSARRVGVVWNGPYSLLCGALLSGWVLLVMTLHAPG